MSKHGKIIALHKKIEELENQVASLHNKTGQENTNPLGWHRNAHKEII